MPTTTMRRLIATAAVGATLLAGCGSSGSDGKAAGTTTTTAVEQKPLTILVSNDDGYAAEGIDVLVAALDKLPDTKVIVYAPLTQQSGQGGKTTDGPLAVTDVKTAGGTAVKAVDGHPADTIRVAMDEDGVKPDVVITGINEGQNLGPLADISGTVGAARAAVARGVPALATSQGSAGFDYETAVPFILDWVKEHRAELIDHTAPVTVANMNIPSCATGTLRGLLEPKPDLDGTHGGEALKEQDCSSTAPESSLTTDVLAFNAGFVTLTDVPAKPATASS